jgi:hypothetical protein
VRQEADAFHEACAELLRERVFRGRRSPWSVKSLVRTVEEVAEMEAAAGEGRAGECWTVVTARLVSILRHERYKQRRVDDYNKAQEQARAER